MEKANPRIVIKVTSPLKLDPKQIDEIKQAVVARVENKDVIAENIVDENIIGGIVIEYGSKIIDLSVLGNITKLSDELKSQ